jgi:hypothetical protein
MRYSLSRHAVPDRCPGVPDVNSFLAWARQRSLQGIGFGVLLAAASLPAAADDLRLSGFATLAIGKVVSGESQTAYPEQKCPCFVADWSRGAIYTDRWSAKQESRLGLQADYRLSDALSLTGQVVARTAHGAKVDAEWAYATYRFNSNWQFQAGRKRLPLYAYSDFQDVGFAYPWVRPPENVYGWEIVNYNGANLTHSTTVGSMSVRTNLFAGSERSKDNKFWAPYYAPFKVDAEWKNIRGIDTEVANDWLSVRANFSKADVSLKEAQSGFDFFPPGAKQTVYGLAANADVGAWVLRGEFGVNDRLPYTSKTKAYLAGVGYKIGALTPMITASAFSDSNVNPRANQKFRSVALTARYDLTSTTAIKAQVDFFRNRSATAFNNSATVLALSIDTVF